MSDPLPGSFEFSCAITSEKSASVCVGADASYLFTDPAGAVARLRELEAAGVTYVVLRAQWFGLGQEQKHKTETSFEADHPEVFASEDRGITPVEYVLVGLASCLTAGVAAVAQNRGIQLRSVESTLEGKMDIRGILGVDSDVRNGYDDIKVTFKIDSDAPKPEIEAIVAQSQKRSAVYDVITNPVNVTVEVV